MGDEDAEPLAVGPVTLQIISLVNGQRSVFDGQWLVDYDPTRQGISPTGAPMSAHIVCTPDRTQARVFDDPLAAHACWTAESGRPPPDARPLTAFHVMLEEV